jgi:hypothetical protein
MMRTTTDRSPLRATRQRVGRFRRSVRLAAVIALCAPTAGAQLPTRPDGSPYPRALVYDSILRSDGSSYAEVESELAVPSNGQVRWLPLTGSRATSPIDFDSQRARWREAVDYVNHRNFQVLDIWFRVHGDAMLTSPGVAQALWHEVVDCEEQRAANLGITSYDASGHFVSAYSFDVPDAANPSDLAFKSLIPGSVLETAALRACRILQTQG